ncbi:MAG: hypothetical protein HOE90_22820 [Bacteriovoracaceae bacterium]|jgi:hypothetical protein|nr:hypothetical protein [Bacteriovoracaceae bacterium]
MAINKAFIVFTLSIFSFSAFSNWQIDCRGIYQKVAQNKYQKRKHAFTIGSVTAAALVVTGVGVGAKLMDNNNSGPSDGLEGIQNSIDEMGKDAAIGMGISFGGGTAALAAGALATSLLSKEEKLLQAEMSASPRAFFRRVIKVAEKNGISLTEEHIKETVSEGFSSGKFCENFPRLMNMRQAQKYILENGHNKSK